VQLWTANNKGGSEMIVEAGADLDGRVQNLRTGSRCRSRETSRSRNFGRLGWS